MAEAPPYAAIVAGWPAFLLAAVLDRELPGQLAAARRHGVHPDRVAAVERMHAAVRQAASEWASATSATSGNDAVPVAGCEVDVTTVAAALGCTPSRIRQRLRAGSLPGRKARGGRWVVATEALQME